MDEPGASSPPMEHLEVFHVVIVHYKDFLGTFALVAPACACAINSTFVNPASEPCLPHAAIPEGECREFVVERSDGDLGKVNVTLRIKPGSAKMPNAPKASAGVDAYFSATQSAEYVASFLESQKKSTVTVCSDDDGAPEMDEYFTVVIGEVAAVEPAGASTRAGRDQPQTKQSASLDPPPPQIWRAPVASFAV